MENKTIPTRALLACGAVAGPLYVAVTMAQALTRDGFDLKQHRFTLLTTGDRGWLHQLNMVGVGVLTVLLAVGVRQVPAPKTTPVAVPSAAIGPVSRNSSGSSRVVPSLSAARS